ncbi:hypothetical protein WJX77_003065 [Trebouxia sp. C0004]
MIEFSVSWRGNTLGILDPSSCSGGKECYAFWTPAAVLAGNGALAVWTPAAVLVERMLTLEEMLGQATSCVSEAVHG